jgi:mono/diheme cytochrome c family protein
MDIITSGKKGTIMPAWKGKLSPQEISAAASYVRSLGGGH